MKLQLWTDGEEFVIAESAAQAIELYKTDMGPDCICGEVDDWYVWLNKNFTFHDGHKDITKTVAEWISLEGKGYFASHNY